jgi:hypothetical protein
MGAAVGFVGADGKGRTVSTADPMPVAVAGIDIPPLEIGGFALPAYDEFELNDEDNPTEIVYKKDGQVVATVTLVYGEGGGLLSGSIAYPEA